MKLQDAYLYAQDYLVMCSLYRVDVGLLPYGEMLEFLQEGRMYGALAQSLQSTEKPWRKPLLFSFLLYCMGRNEASSCFFFENVSPMSYERASRALIDGVRGLHIVLDP